MTALALSGWGQPADALTGVVPDAQAVDYVDCADAAAALALIARQGADCTLAVGWSLGGQLLARAVAQKRIRPKHLVLIAAPYRFVSGGQPRTGMPADTFAQFRANYAHNPARTLRKAWGLLSMGDTRPDEIAAHLSETRVQQVLQHDWLRWLDALSGYSADELDVSEFPPTLLVHGDGDAVVWPEQSRRWHERIPSSRHVELAGCGHAPHWHDPAKLRALIAETGNV